MFTQMLIYLIFVLIACSSQQPQVPENTFDSCTQKLDRGDACCPRPNNTIRFFFDESLQQCFTYLYEGCGGGRNTFYTESECQSICIPADYFNCGGNKPSTGSCNDQDQGGCPAGSSCVKGGLGIGLCCEDANEKAWEEETVRPSCPVGKALTRNVWYGTTVWIGKSCAHRFCPYGYDCVQGKRVAHCCGPIPNFKEKYYPEDNTIGNGDYANAAVVGNTKSYNKRAKARGVRMAATRRFRSKKSSVDGGSRQRRV